MNIANRQTLTSAAVPTALGTFEATFSDQGVRQLRFPNQSSGNTGSTDTRARLLAEELDAYFPELRDLVQHCQFSDCTHIHEPSCAVRAALKEGTIHLERYESYLRLRSGKG